MPLRYLPLALILMMVPGTGNADVYRYIDENGVIRFTDNYIEIPEDQRREVEIITRPEELPPQEVRPEASREGMMRPPGKGGQSDRGEADRQGSESAAEEVRSGLQYEELIKAKADLDRIYNELAVEKEALEKEQQTLKTIESARDFQDKVNRFNQRLMDYERQRRAFQTKAEAYNQSVAP